VAATSGEEVGATVVAVREGISVGSGELVAALTDPVVGVAVTTMTTGDGLARSIW
jgi:hypothetical protein